MITTTIRTLTVAAGLAAASSSMAETAVGLPDIPEQTRRHLAASMLPMMPAEHRAAIIAAGGIGSDIYATGLEPADDGELLVAHDERYEELRGFVSPALFARMDETHLKSLLYRKSLLSDEDAVPVAQCFAPGTDPELVAAYELMFREQFWGGGENGDRFEIFTRWTSTASGGTGLRGTPITLTYSFAPDGSLADNLFNQNRSSQLFSWLNGIYGNPSTWQALFDSVFQDWSDVTGVTYIRELNDDGVEANTLPGQLGVRGDVRIFAVPLDGGFGVLAYNQFPNGGDMVFDAFDSFFNSTSSNSRRLRNVASHEHGHGLGFAHSCPQNATKLMEPSANINFDGPQRDDTLAGQRNYGDHFESNDNAAEATDRGDYSVGTFDLISNVTLDDGNDVDYYRINATEPIQLNITLQPDGGSFLTGPQNPNGSCSSGTLNNFDDNLDLSIEVLASDGSTSLGFANDTGLEGDEELSVDLLTPGDYYIVIDSADTRNGIQRYRAFIDADDAPFDGPSIAAVGSLPEAVQPGTPVSVNFEVLANSDTITDGPDLLYRLSGGAYTRVEMTAQGGGIFGATIPAAECGDTPEFYAEVVGATVGTVRFPAGGAGDPFAYLVGEIGVVLDEDFESPDAGWDDSISTANAGDWGVGTPDGSGGALASDFDGSGQCYLTGLGANEDVDGGRVILRSPQIDFSSGGSFSYAYYFSSNGDPIFDGDFFAVEISYNGQVSWDRVLEVTAESGGWQTASIAVDPGVGTDQTFVRFIAEDVGFNTTVEAGVDAVTIEAASCSTGDGCNDADIAEPFGVLDLSDINAFIGGFTSQDPIADIAAPFGVWDLGDIGAFTSQFIAGCP
jgi:serralysin